MTINQVVVNPKTGIGKVDKDPDSRLDYPARFGNWVPAGDEIQLVTNTVETVTANPLTVFNFSIENDDLDTRYPGIPAVTNQTNTLVWLWLVGGTMDETEEVNIRITTVQGRIFDRTLQLHMRKF